MSNIAYVSITQRNRGGPYLAVVEGPGYNSASLGPFPTKGDAEGAASSLAHQQGREAQFMGFLRYYEKGGEVPSPEEYAAHPDLYDVSMSGGHSLTLEPGNQLTHILVDLDNPVLCSRAEGPFSLEAVRLAIKRDGLVAFVDVDITRRPRDSRSAAKVWLRVPQNDAKVSRAIKPDREINQEAFPFRALFQTEDE